MKKTKGSILIILTCITSFMNAQSHTVKGLVNSYDGPLQGVSIVEKGTNNGITSDAKGIYTILVSSKEAVLEFSFVGYKSQSLNVNGKSVLDVKMSLEIEQLGDVILLGSRFVPRTEITSPVPIDNITIKELKYTGQTTVDQMLNYAVPSYNSSQQAISDATAHFNPADLRGLGPSRTLVLINGKRKNASSLVYINDTPGKGEVGVDMKSIPTAAIERIEVLRDGASALYGSDAIAGVINIILKDDYEYTEVNISSGITSEGDGFFIGYDVNTGAKIGERGFLNLSASYLDQKETNRAPSAGTDSLFGNIYLGLTEADGLSPQEVIEMNDLGQSLLDGTESWISENPTMGMRIGMPNMVSNETFYNFTYDLDDRTELYSFGGLTFRKGKSYALYRTPYWKSDEFNIFHDPTEVYQGFQPTFETIIFDKTMALGIRGETSEWNYDISSTFGSNTVDYTIGNTYNEDMKAQSPITFQAGGYEFNHSVSNFDMGKSFGKLSVGIGSEFRIENFIANAGEEASYFGDGAQSFPGIQPQNAVDVSRYNVGFYTDLGYDITEDIYIGAAVRQENYSDFGENFTWKVSGRYKLLDDKVSFRASASTGFRAPSLHQIYMSNIQTLVSGGTISNQGTFNNTSPVIRSLGVAKLKEENSLNYTFGIAAKPMPGLEFSADVYNIKVTDRIVYSSSIASNDTTSILGGILNEYNVTSIKFFTNAIDTETEGIDLVASYSDIDLGPGKLQLRFALNFNNTSITNIDSTIIDGVDIFDRKEQSRIESSRPADKELLGISYRLNNWTFALNNTRFGEVTWKHESDESKDQTFAAKIITDLNVNYQASEKVDLNISINNLLDVYPDKIDPKGDFITNLGGRFEYPWEVNQFGFMGTMVTGKLTVKF